ncbi:MAG TPA: hypothetical protein VIN40_06220 [Candidatus Tyrphobacter sp.]
MKQHAPSLFLCAIVLASALVPAQAQEQGSLGSMSWGPTGVPGLNYTVACSGLGGPAWRYTFANRTAKPITFSYSFADARANYSHTIPPHERWTLKRVAPRFACSSNGPLRIAP